MELSQEEHFLLTDIALRNKKWLLSKKIRTVIGKLINEKQDQSIIQHRLLEDVKFVRNQRDIALEKISNLLEELQTLRLELSTTRENIKK